MVRWTVGLSGCSVAPHSVAVGEIVRRLPVCTPPQGSGLGCDTMTG
ncbi:hypothetical protein [Streptomyces sp. NBC_01353]|nr:hypothetical protein [Streptomyces sp. NBC_01353]